jgi:ABC-type uncharacterized transport system auxiliary subunit
MTRSAAAIILAFALLSSGCGSSSISQKQTFIPDVKRPSPPATRIPKDVTLEVNRFTIDSAFKSTSLVFRRTDSRYISSYYIEFMQTPTDLFTEETRQWLSRSGLFAMVIEPGNTLRPTHVLEGHIVDYYIDIQTSQPSAVLSVKAVLIKEDAGSQPALILKGIYKATEPAKSTSGEDVMAAMAKCTEKVLAQLEADMTKLSW